ncbi:hypothetical protein RJ55_03308 [Drechmeria coniospora]|nr:hypothetical protein RJ55_03308 [Drechmeria coniospora]
MATPLMPATVGTLNLFSTPRTTMTTTKHEQYEQYDMVRAYTKQSSGIAGEEPAHRSSQMATLNEAAVADQENVSPAKTHVSRHSRVISGVELSPLKILSGRRCSSSASSDCTATRGSPRKLSPEKRFPVKISAPEEAPQTTTPQVRELSLEEAVKQNEGLKQAIEIFEDEQSALEEGEAENGTATTLNVDVRQGTEDEAAAPDDTMVSTFSTFSAVPNMAMLAKLGQTTPSQLSSFGGIAAPRPRHEASPAPSARGPSHDDSGNTTNLLMDFTDQLRFPHKSPAKRGNPSPSRAALNVAATPSRPFSNLIDFEIPPMPTPRSVPTITPRELESLKSGFLSEISSLKASLSGKDAEVQSLKAAVGDAEKRVGESLEQVREERSIIEQLKAEKEDWECRSREMESMLRTVREEIEFGQREREEVEQKLDESEKRREAAEMLHQEAESKMAGMRAGKESDKCAASSPETATPPGPNREVEVAVERVARELHALYKSKHETKVAALKKSYESRWEKKVRELEKRIEELSGEKDRLRSGRDATMTRAQASDMVECKAQAVRDSATIKELNADVRRLEAVAATVKKDNEQLRGMLERERVEKGELVQLAEEMMSMQSFVGQPQHQKQAQEPVPQPQPQPQPQRQAELAKTPRASANGASRTSGLRAPGTGLRAPHERTKSGGNGSGGLPRPGGMPRSGIMSSIEKMGNYRGRAE